MLDSYIGRKSLITSTKVENRWWLLRLRKENHAAAGERCENHLLERSGRGRLRPDRRRGPGQEPVSCCRLPVSRAKPPASSQLQAGGLIPRGPLAQSVSRTLAVRWREMRRAAVRRRLVRFVLAASQVWMGHEDGVAAGRVTRILSRKLQQFPRLWFGLLQVVPIAGRLDDIS